MLNICQVFGHEYDVNFNPKKTIGIIFSRGTNYDDTSITARTECIISLRC